MNNSVNKTTGSIIAQTKKWIGEVVIGCNFCPFAALVFHSKKIHYVVEAHTDTANCLTAVFLELERLDQEPAIATSFLILPNGFENFEAYLDFVHLAENVLLQKNYEGIYQIASFHPLYQFADTAPDDPANYTNRSIYPMVHFLREAMVEQALNQYKNPEEIPEKNIAFAREKGIEYMKWLRDNCLRAEE